MLKKAWMALALIIVLWSQGCTQNDRTPASHGDVQPVELGKTTVLEVPTSQMRQNITEMYRLKPDRRFLLAFGETHFLLRGSVGEEVSVNHTESLNNKSPKWLIKVGGHDAGSLPDYPSFSHLMDSLSAWTQSLTPKYVFHRQGTNAEEVKKLREQEKFFFAPFLFNGLRMADQLWSKKEGDIEALKASAEMLTLLYFQTSDLVETSDILGAKALALVSVLRGFARESSLREEALLAKKMGYEADAILLAKPLGDADPVSCYILKNDEKLKLQANSEEASTFTKYLWLTRLAELGDVTQWEEFRKKHFNNDAAIVASYATAYDRLPYRPLFVQMSVAGLMDSLDFEAEQKRSAASIEEATINDKKKPFDESRFISLVGSSNQHSRGPFLDKATFSSYESTTLQSSLFFFAREEIHNLYLKGNADFKLSILDPNSGDFSNNLSLWYSDLYRQYAKKTAEYGPSIYKNPVMSLGAKPASFIFELAKTEGTQLSLSALRLISSQLDSRPSHLYLMNKFAYEGLYDLDLAKEFTRQMALADETSPNQKLLLLRSENKLDELLRIADDPQNSIEYRLTAARLLLGHESTETSRLRAIYRKLIKSNGNSWAVRSAYLEFLEKNKLFKASEIIIRDYLRERYLANGGFDYLKAKLAMARVYAAQGRNQEAYGEVEGLLTTKAREIMKAQIHLLGEGAPYRVSSENTSPIEKSFIEQNYQFQRQSSIEVIAKTVDLLLENNKLDEAEKIANEFYKEFDNFLEFRILKARIHWARQEWSAAARLVNLHPRPITESEWLEWVAALYKKQNQNLGQEESDLAFNSMLREKFSDERLVKLGSDLTVKPKKWVELRDEFVSHQKLWSQYLIKKLENAEVALQFLKDEVPKEKRNALSLEIYTSGEDDLLWTFIENPEDGGQPEYVWLLRASAILRESPKKDEQTNSLRRETLRHYYSHEGSSHYFTIGRYLLGLIAEQQVFAIATGDKEKCELAYYLGVKAESEKQVTEAYSWYRVVMETELSENSEYTWALQGLKTRIARATHFF